MTMKIRMPSFQNGKEKRQYFKVIQLELDRRYNQHVRDLGDWPLFAQVLEEEQSEICSLFLGKVLEPEEDAERTIGDILAFLREGLALDVYNIERSLFDE